MQITVPNLFPGVLVVLLAATSALAAPVEELPWSRSGGCSSEKYQCSVRIQFGSVCCGPDRDTGAKVMAYIQASKDIDKAIKCPHGREGEYELCLVIANKTKANSVFEALKPMIPAPGSGAQSLGTTSISQD